MSAPIEADIDMAVVAWLASLTDLRASLFKFENLLDARENERAAHFHFPEDRERFIAGRGLLRRMLRRYVPDMPALLELDYSPLGRPMLPPKLGPLAFSISHTGDLVAVALARNARLGVDIELMRPDIDVPGLAERILSPDDFIAFQCAPEDQARMAFYLIWTRKEAYLKARGEGITTALSAVHVPLAAAPVCGLKDDRDGSAESWRLHQVPVPGNYAGSLACDEPGRRVRWFKAGMEAGEVQLETIGSAA